MSGTKEFNLQEVKQTIDQINYINHRIEILEECKTTACTVSFHVARFGHLSSEVFALSNSDPELLKILDLLKERVERMKDEEIALLKIHAIKILNS